MVHLPVNVREDIWKRNDGYKDASGQKHFPDEKLSAMEMDRPVKHRGKKR